MGGCCHRIRGSPAGGSPGTAAHNSDAHKYCWQLMLMLTYIPKWHSKGLGGVWQHIREHVRIGRLANIEDWNTRNTVVARLAQHS